MRPLWILAALFILAALIALFVTTNTKLVALLVILGSACSLADQYRQRRG